jgi:hypothetical protein
MNKNKKKYIVYDALNPPISGGKQYAFASNRKDAERKATILGKKYDKKGKRSIVYA